MTPDVDAAGSAAPAPSRRVPGILVEIVQTLALTLVIFLVIQNFVAQPFQVEQDSMQHTFESGDYVLVDRLSHLWSPYQRGQVVVFRPPAEWTERPEPYIKRVIGLPGDTVEVRDGEVYVNDIRLDEPYLFRGDDGLPEPTTAGDPARWVVAADQLFVLGDHRRASADSRVFGSIPIANVIGRGLVRYWPLESFALIGQPSYEGLTSGFGRTMSRTAARSSWYDPMNVRSVRAVAP